MAEGRPHPTEGSDNAVLPFDVAALDVRGRVVRLGAVADTILTRHNYPAPVSRLLGEAMALTVLLGSTLKTEARFQLQTRTDGLVDMIVVDFEAPGQLRAYARYDTAALAEPVHARKSSAELLGQGALALTIDPGGDMKRYQGVVALEGFGLEEAALQYFRQSEQIPTHIRLAVSEVWPQRNGQGAGGHLWRVGGILVQFLPEASNRIQVRDMDPGDKPQSAGETTDLPEDDSWVEARALVETVEAHELTDPTISSERLLFRLFHERGVRVFEPRALTETCRCSQERIYSMLKSFPASDVRDMRADDGSITVTCEFCSRVYHVGADEAESLVGEG